MSRAAAARRLPLGNSPNGEDVQSPSSEAQHGHQHQQHPEPIDPFFDYGSFLWETSGEVVGYTGIDQTQVNLGFEGGWIVSLQHRLVLYSESLPV
jgi:hypothetical protein